MCMGVCLCVCVCVVHGMCFAHGLGGQDKRTTHAKFRTNTRTVGLSSSSSAPRSTLPSCVRIVKKLSACLPVLRWGFVQRDRQRTSGRTWGTSRPFSEVISIIVSEAKLPRPTGARQPPKDSARKDKKKRSHFEASRALFAIYVHLHVVRRNVVQLVPFIIIRYVNSRTVCVMYPTESRLQSDVKPSTPQVLASV